MCTCGQASSNTANTVFDVKRLIGRQSSDATVKADVQLLPFTGALPRALRIGCISNYCIPAFVLYPLVRASLVIDCASSCALTVASITR